MRIGFISFRLAGTDGVSLESAKIAQILDRMGHKIYYFAGEIDSEHVDQDLFSYSRSGQMLIDTAHYTHPEIRWITEHAFGSRPDYPELRQRIESTTAQLELALKQFIGGYGLDLIIAQNVFALPLNIPLSLALQAIIGETGVPAIAHHHDFYWERDQYHPSLVEDILLSTFPPRLPSLRHLVINSRAQNELGQRGLASQILPNFLDFASEPPGADLYNSDLRRELGLQDGDYLFLQPTRVIPRKGIELSIELVSRLRDLPIKLVISHHAELDSAGYLDALQAQAQESGVSLIYAPEKFAPFRETNPNGRKVYRLWDAYVHADFVTYPSLYEGFGNALVEAIYFRKSILVNRYPIYKEDIEPKGIQAVMINGKVTDAAVKKVRDLLSASALAERMAAHNFEVASREYSYERAESILSGVLNTF
ncbi:MAG: glycosyltransferase family 4 protein [Anaerolineales bacterium]|nr:glycosyltransferase family 4 protein [Anaerolineales bacterium]